MTLYQKCVVAFSLREGKEVSLITADTTVAASILVKRRHGGRGGDVRSGGFTIFW